MDVRDTQLYRQAAGSLPPRPSIGYMLLKLIAYQCLYFMSRGCKILNIDISCTWTMKKGRLFTGLSIMRFLLNLSFNSYPGRLHSFRGIEYL